MKPHVILIADAGGTIGWGHAVRQLALAEALVEKHVPTLFVTRTKEALALDWPCPVSFNDEPFGLQDPPGWQRYVLDCADDLPGGSPTMCFEDHGAKRNADFTVDPHLGAASRQPNRWVSFLGPRWAPLRQPFVDAASLGINRGSHGGVFVYGDAPSIEYLGSSVVRPPSLNARAMVTTMQRCSLALVPPSMIALECLAIGLPVVLYVPGEKWRPIADAMVAAGVAELWDEHSDGWTLARVLADDGKRRQMSEAGREAVDGLGAGRLAEWLADA